jgi:hypothetical protein
MKIGVVALLLLAVCAAPARAQTVEGRASFESGRQAYRDGRFEAAAHDFEEAYRLDHLPGLLFNQALALRKLWLIEPRREVLERAVAAYRAYVRDWPDGPSRKDALDALAELAPLLERTAPVPAPAPAPAPTPPEPKPVESPAAVGQVPAPSANAPLPPPVLVPAPSGKSVDALPPPPQITPSRRRAWVLPVVIGSIAGAALLGVAIGVGVYVTRSISSATDSPSLGTVFFLVRR